MWLLSKVTYIVIFNNRKKTCHLLLLAVSGLLFTNSCLKINPWNYFCGMKFSKILLKRLTVYFFPLKTWKVCDFFLFFFLFLVVKSIVHSSKEDLETTKSQPIFLHWYSFSSLPCSSYQSYNYLPACKI